MRFISVLLELYSISKIFLSLNPKINIDLSLI
jgi:hypothetical protein